MKALLLAAGLGTRLRPITDTVPKCLVPIRGKPLLGYWFDLLFPAGVESAVVNTHYFPGAVRAFVAASSWRDRVRLVHEEELLGTGGTVLACRDFFRGAPFLVIHADNLSRFDVAKFIDAHRKRPTSTDMTMMTFRTDDPRSCGIVKLDERGVVMELHEKVTQPPGDIANAAVYIFEPSVVDLLASLPGPFIDISTQVLPRLLGRIYAFHNANFHRDIGNPESLRLAQAEYPAAD
jgi:mannose-1-phosphate guanylyltransferase